MTPRKTVKTVKVIHRHWAAIVKMKPGSYWPYKVVVGPRRTFHSWGMSRGLALNEAARINKSNSGYLEEVRR